MKIGLVFYSFSGNTKRVFEYLKEKFLSCGDEVEFIQLKPVNEPKSFFRQGLSAFLKNKPLLSGEIPYDLEGFDYLILGSPLWAFTFAPALRSYLDKVKGLKGKKVRILFTYGSGAGLDKGIRELKELLENKGAQVESFLGLSGSKVKDKNYLEEKLKDFLRL